MKDTELEWFRPLWLRSLVTGLVGLWFLYEIFISQDQFWMFITGAALAYAVWNLFIQYDKRMAEKQAKGGGGDKPSA